MGASCREGISWLRAYSRAFAAATYSEAARSKTACIVVPAFWQARRNSALNGLGTLALMVAKCLRWYSLTASGVLLGSFGVSHTNRASFRLVYDFGEDFRRSFGLHGRI